VGNVAFQIDPELQQAIQARIQYCRDLGVYDFYRRGEPLPYIELRTNANTVTNRNLSVTATVTNDLDQTSIPAPNFQSPSASEENAIAARKPMPAAPAIGPVIAAAGRADALHLIREDIGDCTRCPLAFAGRNKIVFGDGDANARLMFVGEGPGADEDRTGLPFVGKAGQLLNNMINAMGLRREQVYIANIVKCRPPANRVPEPEEAHTCTQFLFRQIDVIRPEVIVALGSTAATYLLGAKSPLGALRGRVHPWRDAKLIVTYHPAFLLRDPTQKKAAWYDLRIAMAELGLQPPSRPIS
jgi:uracil-DNA glycosylase